MMFHSVGLRNHAWAWRHLSEPVDAFSGFVDFLAEHGFQTISLAALQAHMAGDERAPPNSIVLTFDDGYLDNWVYAAPILRRRGFTGTVFVSTDFIDPGGDIRPTLEEVWNGRCGVAELKPAGFMNREELRAVDQSGTLQVQSHAKTHTWYPVGPEIVGWHDPQSPNALPWVAWNAKPERKPFYLGEDQRGFVPQGTPIFRNDCALTARRFFPDKGAVDDITKAIQGRLTGTPAKAGNPATEKTVINVVSSDTVPGKYEHPEEKIRRVSDEIRGSRTILSEILGKSVDYICWPAGGSDDFCETAAAEAGYAGWMLRSNQERHKRNRPGVDPQGIRRLSAQRFVHIAGKVRGEGGLMYQRLQVETHRNSSLASGLLRAYKLLKWLRFVPAANIEEAS
jgi:peptidoglycan/xylan/chitin deacetylase (PgdA/CDA1 family)